MPPKCTVTREMILDAAFALCREEEKINARTLAERLGCSTQPILYQFGTMEELMQALYEKVDAYHSEFLMVAPENEDFLLNVGLNYIRFGLREPSLFKFLFQSGWGKPVPLMDLCEDPRLEPMLLGMAVSGGLSLPKARQVFLQLAIFAHGYASLVVGGSLAANEADAARALITCYRGALSGGMGK